MINLEQSYSYLIATCMVSAEKHRPQKGDKISSKIEDRRRDETIRSVKIKVVATHHHGEVPHLTTQERLKSSW